MIIWDAANGREISHLPGPQPGPWLSFEASLDGKCYVADLRGLSIGFRDMRSGALKFHLDGRTDYRNAIRISPNGAMFAANVHGEFVVWDTRTGKEMYTRDADSFVVRDIAFSPDSKLLATTGDDGIVKFWDTATGEGRSALPVQGKSEITSIAFSPDGSRLAGGGLGKALRIWNVADGELVQTIEVHAGGFYCLAFSPDGARLAAAGRELLLLNTATGEETISLAIFSKEFNVANDIAFSSDGLNLFCRSQNGKLVVLETAPRPTTK
jgi:WD40 repeat protein